MGVVGVVCLRVFASRLSGSLSLEAWKPGSLEAWQDIVMKLRKEALTREEQAEQNKQERLKMQRHQNQAFLFQQIAERDHQKRVAEETHGSLSFLGREGEFALVEAMHVYQVMCNKLNVQGLRPFSSVSGPA